MHTCGTCTNSSTVDMTCTYVLYISLKSSHVKLKVKAESFYIDSESTFKRLFAAVAPLPSPTFVHALLSFSFFANASVN